MTTKYPYVFQDYEHISNLSADGKVQLVKYKFKMELYVLKQLVYYDLQVYRYIKEHKSRFCPEIYELYEEDGTLYVLEEFVAGDSLENVVKYCGFLNTNQVRQIALDLCEALIPFHQMDPPVVHRDLKPENLIRTPEGIIKIIDFDTARQYDEGNFRDTVVMGTRMFAAPEQFGYAQTDPRSDIYAIGVLMNYLLCGKDPRTEIPEGSLQEIIARASRFDPDNRYQSLTELQKALKQCLVETKAEKERKTSRNIREGWLPGFRSGKIWKMVVAVLGYAALFYVSFTIELHDANGTLLSRGDQVLNRVFMLLIGFLLVFFLFNFRGVHRHLPLMGGGKSRYFGYVIYSVLSVMVPMVILVFVEALLF